MSLAGAERVVAAAEASGRVCGLSHPMRFRPERLALCQRVGAGEERIRHIAGRFFISRLTNVGATGYQRSWTDNLLWHHMTHFIDAGMQLLEGQAVRQVLSCMGPVDVRTGVPMTCSILVETEGDATLLVDGSYEAGFRLYDELIVTGRDSYAFDTLTATLRRREGTTAIEDEATNCARVITDFLAAVRDARPPLAPPRSALPAMQILQAVQDGWDARYGRQALPGRPLG
jgi:2-hydroxy-4-carboxymuconate semialdehyde hemiacetal dehydrogenase